MAPEALTGREAVGLLAMCGLILGCGFRQEAVAAAWKIEPSPPIANAPAVVRVMLYVPGGMDAHRTAVVSSAKLRLEAHMPHPGMAPVTADMIERAAGNYESSVRLSMDGAWTLVVTGTLADGRRITKQMEVTAVR